MPTAVKENRGKEVIVFPKTRQEASQYFVDQMAKLFEMLYKVELRERIRQSKQYKKENLCPPTK